MLVSESMSSNLVKVKLQVLHLSYRKVAYNSHLFQAKLNQKWGVRIGLRTKFNSIF